VRFLLPALLLLSCTCSPKTAPTRAAGTDEVLQVVENPPKNREQLIAVYADLIREAPFNYGNVGSVLEALAVEGMRRRYPEPLHSVVSGIEYKDATGRTVGELDLVVLHNETGDALVVSEVKLSGNLRAAEQKANTQIKRFRESIANGEVVELRLKGGAQTNYRPSQFTNVLIFGKIGSKGAVAEGFDWEVDLSRDEGDELQAALLNKNSSGTPAF